MAPAAEAWHPIARLTSIRVGSPHDILRPQSALGLSTVNGLPAHILIVHAVVVLVPLSALALVAAQRRGAAVRLGGWLPAVCLLSLLSVFAAMNAGSWLQNHVNNDALVREHTAIAGQLWPFSAAVAVMSAVVWWRHRRSAATVDSRSARRRRMLVESAHGSVAMSLLVAIVSIAVAAGSVVEVVRIGESGSRAAWHDHFSQQSVSTPH